MSSFKQDVFRPRRLLCRFSLLSRLGLTLGYNTVVPGGES